MQLSRKDFAKASMSAQKGLDFLSTSSEQSYACRMERADLIAAQAQIYAERGDKSKAHPLYQQAEIAYAALGPQARVNLAGCLEDHLKWVPQASAEAAAIRKQLHAL